MLSAGIESAQTYLLVRVPSNVDFALNTLGGLVGAALAWLVGRPKAAPSCTSNPVRGIPPSFSGSAALSDCAATTSPPPSAPAAALAALPAAASS